MGSHLTSELLEPFGNLMNGSDAYQTLCRLASGAGESASRSEDSKSNLQQPEGQLCTEKD